MGDPHYDTYMGHGPKEIAQFESWSCPDAETAITGIDYYEHPRLCRLKMRELYPRLWLRIPDTDEPRPRPTLGADGGPTSNPETHAVRWGDGETGTWEHGETFFKDEEDVFAFSPLEKADFSDMPVVVSQDFSSEEIIYERYRAQFPAEWGDKAPEGSSVAAVGFYNTMFMWPLLTFGWDLFLRCCLDERFERVMDEFAEINRRVFRAFARLPVNFVMCHDDIATAQGPVCPPDWMRRFIFERYEEFWGIVKASGKEVIFIVDGNVDALADDIMACGARGIRTEPFTDFKALARRYENIYLCGEGDNRVLSRNDPEEIRAMVESMVETGRMTGGYHMSVGNHIPWNLPPEAVKRYLDLVNELAWR